MIAEVEEAGVAAGAAAPAAPAGKPARPRARPRRRAPWARERAAWLTLSAALAAWGSWFIFRTSFVLDGRRVFCLFDDAMTSMTYARNLLAGYGLNWARQGAPVEGFTHPLWTALMVPVNLLPLPLDRRSLVVQAISLALLVVEVALVRSLVLRHFTRPGARHWLPAGVLTAFYYPLAYWALVGMETGLQAVLATASVLLALDIVHGRRDRHLALWVTSTLAVLLRMDMAPLVIAVQLWVVVHGGLRRAGPLAAAARRHWLAGAAVLVAAVGGYTLFRWVYFHDLLPNTYYLKLGAIPLAVRLLRGGSVLLDTLQLHWPLLLVVGLGVAPQAVPAVHPRRDREWGRRLALPAIVFVLCCAYSVYVGGDAWEGEVNANRFVAFVMPLVFVLFNALANQALAAIKRRWRRRRRQRRREAGPGTARRAAAVEPLPLRYALLAVTAAALVAANGLWQGEELEENWKTFTLLSRPTHADEYAKIIRSVRALRRLADPGASVAVTWAGTPAYFSDFRMVDILGYNDRHVARGRPAHRLDEDTFDEFVPGHVKWDYPYLLAERRPDVFLQLWVGAEALPLLRARGYRQVGDLWIAPWSPRIHLPPEALAGEPAGESGEEQGEEAAPAAAPAPAVPPAAPALAVPPAPVPAAAAAPEKAGPPGPQQDAEEPAGGASGTG